MSSKITVYNFIQFMFLGGIFLLISSTYSYSQCKITNFIIEGQEVSPVEITPDDSSFRFVDDRKGNDENNGTKEKPWKTLQHAVNNAFPGVTIIVMPGNYGAQDTSIFFHKNKTGEESKWITIKGYIPHTAIVNCGINTRGNKWTDKGCGWLRIEGLVFKGGIFIHNTQNAPVEIINNKFDLIEHGGVAIGGSNHVNATQEKVVIKGNFIEGASYGINTGQSDNSKDWLIENNIIKRIIYRGSGDADYVRVFGSGHVFKGNIFYGTSGKEKGAAHTDGFQTYTNGARNIQIVDNIISGFDQGIMASTSIEGAVNENWVIKNNVFSGTYADSLPGGSYAICIHASAGSAKGWVIEGNVFANNRYHGIYLGANTSDMTVVNNFYYNSEMYTSFDKGRVGKDMNVGQNKANRTSKQALPTDTTGVDATKIFLRPENPYLDPESSPDNFKQIQINR